MFKKNIKEILLYFTVGGIATLSEWILFFILNKLSLHYALATVAAYTLSTFVNWFMGRVLVFKKTKSSLFKEIAGIYLASAIGLLLNLLIMWVAVDILSVNEMLSKVIATALVFIYNYLVRKCLIYRTE